MKKYLADYAFLLSIAGVLIFLDQITKQWVRTNMSYGEVLWPELWLTQFARIVHTSNTGAAFGMFKSLGNIFMVLSFIVGLAILYYFPQVPRQDWSLRLSLGMLLGGAVGNLIDRLTVGSVTDFISILNLPVFNLADLSITLGVVVLLLGMWLQERAQKRLAVESDRLDPPRESQ